MIYIIHKALTTNDKQAFVKILAYANIPETLLKFVDITSEDLDLNGKDFIFAINTYKEIAKSFVASGVFEMRQVLGSDIFDEQTNFALINIPYSINDLFANNAAKQTVWLKINNFYKFYQECMSKKIEQTDNVPFDDPLPMIEESAIPADETIEDNTEEKISTVDVSDLLLKLAENLDLSDPALGKSLTSSNKIEFETEDLKICIYPNNRIPKKDVLDNSLNLSFKDMLAILKLTSVFDAKKISFFKVKE